MRALGGISDWGEALLADSPDSEAIRLSLVDTAGELLWAADVSAAGLHELRVARDGSGFSAVIGEHLLGWTLERP